MFAATELEARNHSTTAPVTASRKNRNGRPSRRSSLASCSGPKARAAPPTTWASPSQARVTTPGPSSATGYFTVFWAAVPRAEEVVELVRAGVFRAPAVDPRVADAPRARGVDLLLVAMRFTLPGATDCARVPRRLGLLN